MVYPNMSVCLFYSTGNKVVTEIHHVSLSVVEVARWVRNPTKRIKTVGNDSALS